MSISIVKKDLRKALDWLSQSKGLRLWFSNESVISYDGEYIILTQGVGGYEAIGTGHSCPSFQANRATYYMTPKATVKAVGNDTSIYFFFMEPRKAVYNDYQGFRHDGVNHCMEFRKGGAEEQDNIAGQDWTTDHEFKIAHKKDETDCIGYIDGVEKAHCTDNTKISAQPFSIYCIEPNGVARTCHLKYPPGIEVA